MHKHLKTIHVVWNFSSWPELKKSGSVARTRIWCKNTSYTSTGKFCKCRTNRSSLDLICNKDPLCSLLQHIAPDLHAKQFIYNLIQFNQYNVCLPNNERIMRYNILLDVITMSTTKKASFDEDLSMSFELEISRNV